MNLEKLIKQLRRDIAANPKKAAALGLMVLVALYFWGPLAWKFIAASGPKRDSKAAMASLILTDDPIEPGQQSQARRGPKFRWEKVRQLIGQDSHMTSAAFDIAWIDPFGKPNLPLDASAGGEAEADPATTAAAAAQLDTNSLGLALGSIMTGPRGRVATINGESYREGDQISLTEKHDKTATVRFRVVKINRHSVELEAGGRTFTLELIPPKLAPGDDIERGQPKP